jgi:hypothetical protein
LLQVLDFFGTPLVPIRQFDVAGEIPYGHGRRLAATGELARGLEGAVAVAQQHGDRVGRIVADDQVRDAIAIEIRPSRRREFHC